MAILDSVEVFLARNSQSFEFVPTNLNINNLTLTTQLTSFNNLLSERITQRTRLGPSHPDIAVMEKQIQNLRQTIIENIRSIKSDISMTSEADKMLRENLTNRLQSLPTRERELGEIERKKNIKENLYLYLLQKREESTISRAAMVSTGRVIEPARASSDPVSPKIAQTWLIAIFMGLALPTGLVLLLESLNDKIESEEEVVNAVSIPLVGKLIQTRKKDNLVVQEGSYTAEAEMFRLLRANLAYVSPGKTLQTLLITSSISGEGKSHITLNLGITQALAGKKVIILEMDLRKPRKQEMVNGQPLSKGVVNYLVDPKVSTQQIIQKSGLHPSLDRISCGPKPPNPSELLLSTRLRTLILELKEEYDFIIIDAPPVGLVADALQMKDIVDATMYVVRSNFSRKGHLQIIKDIVEKDKLPRPFFVFNGMRLKEAVGYGYGSNGYYQDRPKARFFSRQKKKKKVAKEIETIK